MRKILLLFIAVNITLTSFSQLVTRVVTPSPIAAEKGFSTSFGKFYVTNSSLVKLAADGTTTSLINFTKGKYSTIKFDDFKVVSDNQWLLLSYIDGKDAYFYMSDGTAANTRLVYSYKSNSSLLTFFTIMHKGKGYILATYYPAAGGTQFKGLIEADPATGQNKTVVDKSGTTLSLNTLGSDGDNLYMTHRDGSVNTLSTVSLTDGSLTQVANDVNYWATSAPLYTSGNKLLYWGLKDTTVQMNGSNFQTKRTVLRSYNATTTTSDVLMYAGYFQATLPWYLGEIDGKVYFLTLGNLSLDGCQDVSCQGTKGAALWETTANGSRLIKFIPEGTNTISYNGIYKTATDKIYLEISTKNEGKELWAATPTDLYRVKDFNPGASSLKDYGLQLSQAATCGGKIAIPGVGALASTGNDYELYVSDGTVGNLEKIDILPGSTRQSYPKALISMDDKIYFTANDTIAATSLFAVALCSNIVQGIEQPETELSVYPNPATDILYLNTSTPVESVEIYSLTGMLVARPLVQNNSIDIRSLRKGTYLLKISGGPKLIVKKFTI